MKPCSFSFAGVRGLELRLASPRCPLPSICGSHGCNRQRLEIRSKLPALSLVACGMSWPGSGPPCPGCENLSLALLTSVFELTEALRLHLESFIAFDLQQPRQQG